MSDSSIQIEYNQVLQALEALLSQVRRSGDFFVSGTRETPMPQVTVEGVGVLMPPASEEPGGLPLKRASKAKAA